MMMGLNGLTSRTAFIGFVVALATAAPPQELLAGTRPFELRQSDTRLVHLPEPNTEAEVEVGQSVISTGQSFTAVVLSLKQQGIARYGSIQYKAEPGAYLWYGSNEKGRYFFSLDQFSEKLFFNYRSFIGGVFLPNDPSQSTELCWWNGTRGADCAPAPGLQYEVTSSQKFDTKAFRQELIYAGLSNGEIKFTYKEFSDDLARPAFNQDISYDLKAGDEIGYKGARIKILKANNVSVRYIVLKSLE